jgi:ADP-heptose:LPS heptosyltransferase
MNWIDLAPYLNHFLDTALAARQMDLIITVDTSMAHLSGALALPVWVLIPPIPDWRWLLEREDSPWYPTMRLLRRNKEESWGNVVSRIIDLLLQNNMA